MTHQANGKDTDLLGRIDTSVLYPPYLELLNALLNACADRGQLYVATSGLRTYEEQTKLYAQGRTSEGKIVTKAKAGQSAHNHGIAVDFAPHVGESYAGKLRPDYAASRYLALGQEAARLGLEWGGAWKSFQDNPHVQWRLPQGITLGELDIAYRTSGIQAAWGLLRIS
jgi:peptidoglycan L-alanyl-D-glutamate endopeptidase CwlK